MGDEQYQQQQQQRGFVRVPVDTIQSCVDRLDVQASEEVASGLAEDVSFRIRQIAEVLKKQGQLFYHTSSVYATICSPQSACQFMHHSKRRRLTVEDMDRAMKHSGLEVNHSHSLPFNTAHSPSATVWTPL